jgi:AcrR family transcriptional regulator
MLSSLSRALLAHVATNRVTRQDVIMSQTGPGRPSVLRAARERTRAETTRQILDAARRHLATDGASGLSLRAIARELGASSSAVYRYVASRDELLTMLIVAAYDALGAATEAEEAAVARGDLAGRWSAVCDAVQGWALANPNEYALIYGTPVPGYVAPAATIAPAARVSSVLLGILTDAAGHLTPAIAEDNVPPGDREALAPLRFIAGPGVPDALLQRGLMALAALFGTVSFELFGQLHGIVGEQPGDREAFFAESVRRWAEQIGISPDRGDPAPDARQLKPAGTAETAVNSRAAEDSTSPIAKEASP